MRLGLQFDSPDRPEPICPAGTDLPVHALILFLQYLIHALSHIHLFRDGRTPRINGYESLVRTIYRTGCWRTRRAGMSVPARRVVSDRGGAL
jgi:hypothetical protein